MACHDVRAPAVMVTVRNTFINVDEDLQSPVSRKRSNSWDGPYRSYSKSSCSNSASEETSELNDDSHANEDFPIFVSTPTPTRASLTSSFALTDFAVSSSDDDQDLKMPESTPIPTRASWTATYGSTPDRFGMKLDGYPLPTLLSQMVTSIQPQPTFIPCATLGVLPSVNLKTSPGSGDAVANLSSSMLKQSTPPVPSAEKGALDILSEELKVACQELPSLGSVAHQRGTCKPCAFGANCRNGANCEFCHLCVAPQRTKGGRWILKRRKRTEELHADMMKLNAGEKPPCQKMAEELHAYMLNVNGSQRPPRTSRQGKLAFAV
jgi:hypothetical protein